MKIPKDIRDKYAAIPREFQSDVDISDLLALLPRPYEALTADEDYFDQNYDNLLEQYPDEWIAILDRRVVGHAKHPMRLLADLKRRELHELAPVVQFVEKTPRHLSL